MIDLHLTGYSLGVSCDFRPRLTVRRIQHVVADYYNIPRDDMRSARRGRQVSWPRQAAMSLARDLTLKSLPDIGNLFNRDHTTVMHALKAVRQRVETDADYAFEVETLRGKLAR
jgi:chromosomal replication initiator protein